MSGRFVAAMRITVLRWSNPSISTSSWFSVCSRSSCPPPMPGAALAADGVDLVDEHDGGRGRLGLLEEVAHAGRSHPHEHLHEVRAADLEERHAGLARHGASQERLAGPRRPEQEDAARDLGAHRLELGGILEEVLDLLQLLDGLVDARDVGEGGLGLILVHDLVLASPELHHPAAARLGSDS